MWACLENSGEGGKTRCSFSWDSIFVSDMESTSTAKKQPQKDRNTKSTRSTKNLVPFVLFVFLPLPFCLCGYFLLLGNSEVLVVHWDVVLPLLWYVVLREDRRYWAGRLTGATINAFLRMNVKHRGCLEIRLILFRMDAVHRAGVE